ncbi:MAG: formate dehydrogenase accessory sulfurtransferase FdhD [Deltaproteobacteria bacterium]|nr:MAG: formate dehydrogenase accessory sulfurtransferase FdhD [Deltaproteobacteria bacterium]
MTAPPPDERDGCAPRPAVRFDTSGRGRPRNDTVAVEAPLEIRVGAVPVAVVMRTPGDDIDLARGFALTERIVTDPAHLRSVRHCDRVEPGHAPDNVVRIVLTDDAPFDADRFRRNMYATSSCGICGKASIDRAMATAPPLPPADVTIPAAHLWRAFAALRRMQPIFDATGGTHAAALADVAGEIVVVREDVGRHNAVDKVVGAALRAAWPGPTLLPPVLLVSGRISFEIVQKALAVRIPVVAGISAPTSLAIDLAEQAGLTLAGFVREETMNVYTHPARCGIDADDDPIRTR